MLIMFFNHNPPLFLSPSPINQTVYSPQVHTFMACCIHDPLHLTRVFHMFFKNNYRIIATNKCRQNRTRQTALFIKCGGTGYSGLRFHQLPCSSQKENNEGCACFTLPVNTSVIISSEQSVNVSCLIWNSRTQNHLQRLLPKTSP